MNARIEYLLQKQILEQDGRKHEDQAVYKTVTAEYIISAVSIVVTFSPYLTSLEIYPLPCSNMRAL